MNPMTQDHRKHLTRFYEILNQLGQGIGKHQLKDCHGKMAWPGRGVYFFFEKGEFRPDGYTPRVVRVGTHAVSSGSKTTLWRRLRTHRGHRSGTGNHRGSVFRLLIGEALLARDDALTPKLESWGQGKSASRGIRQKEAHIERAVSAYIGSMPFLWIDADDGPGVNSIRKVIESNAIALLSGCDKAVESSDPPSPTWLGRYSARELVRRSGLWNRQHSEGDYDPTFLELLADCAKRTRRP